MTGPARLGGRGATGKPLPDPTFCRPACRHCHSSRAGAALCSDVVSVPTVFRLLSVRTIFCVWWRHLACASAVQQVQAPNQAGGNPAASPVISPPCKLHFRTPGHHRCHPASHLLPGVTAAWVTSHPFASSLCHLNPNHLHLSDFDATAGVL